MRFAGVAMALVVVAGAGRSHAAEPGPLTATCARAGDRAEVAGDVRQAVVAISSPKGIGEATLSRIGERWPETVVLRLKLTGLEMLTLENGSQVLNVSVQSHGNHSITVNQVSPDGRSESLAPSLVRMLNPGGKATLGLPDPGGWFELDMPRSFLTPDAKSISVRWVDFYR